MIALIFAVMTALPSATPRPLPSAPPGPCYLMLQQAGLFGAKITPMSIGKLYGVALGLRLKNRTIFTVADMDGAAEDIERCFQFPVSSKKK